MLLQPEVEDVAVERRPVLLPHDQHHVFGGERMRPAAGYEMLVVEDAVVLVRDLLEDHVLVLGVGHEHQVLEGVVEVAGVVHVDVGRAAPPPLGGHVGDPGQPQRQLGHVARGNFHIRAHRLVLESPDGLDFERSDGELHPEAAGLVEGVLPGAADPGVGVRRGVEAAVGGGEMDPRGHFLAGRIVHGAHREHPHGPAPVPPGDLDGAPLPAVGLEERELRQPRRVVDVGDPLAVRRPARVEGVVLEEGQLVG